MNSFGKLFVVTSFGESHGRFIGAVIDGCPAGLILAADDIQAELDRRRPVAEAGGTPRQEEDRVEVLSGVFNGATTGAPVCLLVWNRDFDSTEYERNRSLPRPGHADYTSFVKYGGFADFRGGGRSSGRITAGYVMAGAVARKLLGRLGTQIIAHAVEIGGIRAAPQGIQEVKENASGNPLHCADPEAAQKMTALIEKARKEGDSVGGVIEGIALGLPAGLGEPVFDTLEGEMSRALFAIPGVKGVEFGSGFAGARVRGSENNDPFVVSGKKVTTATNNSGGVLGGISNGMPVVVRVAIKPAASIARHQQTVNLDSLEPATLTVSGRHDVCIVPRAVPVVEAMMAVTLCDLAMRAGLLPRAIK